MSTDITNNESTQPVQTVSWKSWLTFGYLGSSEQKTALGRNTPNRDFTKVLLSPQGKALFVATSAEELQDVRRNLRKVSAIPVAPKPPVNSVCQELKVPENFLEELLKRTNPYPGHDENNCTYSFWKMFKFL